ncbi:hypothetical protein, partial [Fulvivirga lutimaris]|uniref:hypothetical protein n=1 Tax=Fulvivirga lutimaris TaxID=1819566 RepID=UPI0012BD1225
MKIIYSLLISFILLPTASFADMGTCYCMKVEITTDEGQNITGFIKQEGYDLYIEKESNEFHYYSDRVKKVINFTDSITNPLRLKLSEDNKEFFSYVNAALPQNIKLYSDKIEANYNETNYDKRIVP